MAQVIVTESSLENIAGAIRSKLGTQDTYKPSEMAGAIAQIHGDPVLEALNVNANGTYTPSSGKDGFSQAVVNVPNTYASGDEGKVVSGGALVAQSSQSITQNGTYDTTLKNQAIVNVPNSYSASDEGKVVDNGALVAQGSQSIIQNGTYDTTLKNQVVVNVSGGGGGSKNILGGTTAPTSADGTDGDIYIKYSDYSDLSGYTVLEYLQSSGTQWIDTGVPARVQQKAEIDCQWLSSGDQTVLGGSSNVNNNAIFLGYNSSNNRTYVGYANSWHDFNSGAVNQNRHKWIIDLKNNQQTMMVDDSQFATTSNSFSETTSTTNLFMFARSTGASAFIGRIYNVKIYDYLDNGNLIRDFIPVKRNSDDVLGMYDLVNDVFYTNSGTGSFIGGEELTGKPIDAAYLKVSGAWIPLEDGDWDDVNTGE